MSDELGYVVSVKSTGECLARLDHSRLRVTGRRSVGPGSLVRIGSAPPYRIALVTQILQSVREEVQPYVPTAMRSGYLPSSEDFRESYLDLCVLGELSGANGDVRDSTSGDGGVGTDDASGGPIGTGPGKYADPELSEPVFPVTDEESVLFHGSGGAVSMSYLAGLMDRVEPGVLSSLVENVRDSHERAGKSDFGRVEPFFRAACRHVRKGVRR